MSDSWKTGIVIIVCLSVVLELAPLLMLMDGRDRVDATGNDLPFETWHEGDVFVNGSYAPVQDCRRYSAFSSESEIKEFVADDYADRPAAEQAGGGNWFSGPTLGAPTGVAGGGSSRDYSQTNVQVAGVDEQDIVKTDGDYVYTVSGDEVVIVKAYPSEEAKVESRIAFNPSPAGIFIDGDRLVVISGSAYPYERWYGYNGYQTETHVWLYDMSDRKAPILFKEYTVSGGLASARMVGGYVYVVTTDYLQTYGGGISLPAIGVGSVSNRLTPSQIGHFGDEGVGSGVTVVFAVNAGGDGSHSARGYMTGGLEILYVSHDNMYVATSFYHYGPNGDSRSSYEQTAIHKIQFLGLETGYVCSGEVPGRLLNQFSMDEYEGNLRVATTIGWSGWGGKSGNNVYVLDQDMAPLGALEGLAPGEQIHSARFLGDRAYLVTFKKIDPFFVIDLSDPAKPRVLGYLKIPGFSDYLHPYGENLVIGLGKDTVEGQGGNFAWFQGLKLSLFDVTDVENPKEIAKAVIGDRGTDSEALREHKAFMFDEARGILGFPVDLYEISEPDPNKPDSTYGSYVWQGVYVYKVSQDGGFEYIGRVSHGAAGQPYYHSTTEVRRSLYIEDVLYTVSEAYLKLNDLTSLDELKSISL